MFTEKQSKERQAETGHNAVLYKKKLPRHEVNILHKVLCLVTIEPMALLQGIATMLAVITQNQMILYKTCMEPKFNLSREFCQDIESHTDSPGYDRVEETYASFVNYITITEYFTPILLSFYMGSWSDMWGRRPIIWICISTALASSVFDLLNAYYLEEWSRWVWLGTVVAVRNLSGGTSVLTMILFSFMADNTTPRDRTLRTGVIMFLWRISAPIAFALGAWLFELGGFLLVFSTSMTLMFLAWVYIFARLWNFEEKIKRTESFSLGKALHPSHIIKPFQKALQRRPDNKRMYLWICLAVAALNYVPSIADQAFQFLYTKRFFRWNVADYSWFETLRTVSYSCGVAILLPLFHCMYMPDGAIVGVSVVSIICANLCRGFARSPTLFYASAAIDFASSIYPPALRSQVTRCVSKNELGQVYAVLASLEAAIPIVATIVYTKLYTITREYEYPATGTCYFLSSSLVSLALMLTLLMAAKLKCDHIPLGPADDEQILDEDKHNEKIFPSFRYLEETRY